MNIYAVKNQVDCSLGVEMIRDAVSHKASFQDLHGDLLDYQSLPVLMYRTYVKVNFSCVIMLCREAQLHLPTNLCRIDMHSGAGE
jgi:hypothetical protein